MKDADFCSHSRRTNRRIVSYVTVCATPKTDKKTNQLLKLFRTRSLRKLLLSTLFLDINKPVERTEVRSMVFLTRGTVNIFWITLVGCGIFTILLRAHLFETTAFCCFKCQDWPVTCWAGVFDRNIPQRIITLRIS